MCRSGRIGSAVLGALTAAILSGPTVVRTEAATASGTVEVSHGQLLFVAAPGVRNAVAVSGGPTRSAGISDFVVTDRAEIAAGQGCTQIAPTEVRCDPTSVIDVVLYGGDRSDSLTLDSYILGRLDGGAGDDRLRTYGSVTDLEGGLGNDTLDGSSGTDALSGDEGNDFLSAKAGRDRLDGGPGNDKVFGGEGADFARGGEGDDALAGQKGQDSLRSDSGNDMVVGGVGKDREVGGPGIDSIRGGRGDDSIATSLREDPVDSRVDSVQCGDGTDDVTGERLDSFGPACEFVTTTV